MSKFFETKSKLIHYIYAILFALVLVLALYFMTNYAHIHIFYNEEDGVKLFTETAAVQIGGKNYADNQYLFDYLHAGNHPFGSVTEIIVDGWTEYGMFKEEFSSLVFNFQMSMSQYNDLIITYVICGLICVALYVIFSNHNRRVYYKSNLIVGVLVPLAMLVFSVIMIVKCLDLSNQLTENMDLFKMVAIMQNPNIDSQLKDAIAEGRVTLEEALVNADDVTNNTFYIAMVAFVIVAVYSAFLMVYAVLRYKGSAKRRNEIIERAAQQND